jgi:hypothetical protein
MEKEPRVTVHLTAHIPIWVWGAVVFALVAFGIACFMVADAAQALATR